MLIAAFVFLAVVLETLFPSNAGAYELNVSWDPPLWNADSTDCTQDGGPITNYRGQHLWMVDFARPDTTDWGEVIHPVTSILKTVRDGMQGEVMARSVKNGPSGLILSCLAAHSIFTTPALPPPPPTTGTGLRGERFTWDSWNDFKSKLGEQTDSTVNFNWGAASMWPGGPVDYTSIRETGTVTIPTAGTYRFYVTASDGTRLFLGPTFVKVQDYWTHRRDAETFSEHVLVPGELPIRLECYTSWGTTAKLTLSWEGPGIPKQIIPKGALNP